jgi:hypothetical protein
MRELAPHESGEEKKVVTVKPPGPMTPPGPGWSLYPEELPPGLVIEIVKARGDLLDKERELLRAKLRGVGGDDKRR